MSLHPHSTSKTRDIPFTTRDTKTSTRSYYRPPKYKIFNIIQSLKDTIARMKPVLDNDILPQIKEGKNVLVVGHGNTIRSILKVLRNISDEGKKFK